MNTIKTYKFQILATVLVLGYVITSMIQISNLKSEVAKLKTVDTNLTNSNVLLANFLEVATSGQLSQYIKNLQTQK